MFQQPCRFPWQRQPRRACHYQQCLVQQMFQGLSQHLHLQQREQRWAEFHVANHGVEAVSSSPGHIAMESSNL